MSKNRNLLTVSFLAAALAAVLCVGCASAAKNASLVTAMQTPGAAAGAGGTLTAPGNSAAPSTQESERTTVYAPDPAPDNGAEDEPANPAAPVAAPLPKAANQTTAAAAPGPARPLTPKPPAPPRMLWSHEKTTTTIGQHQDAAGILKVAGAAGSWSKVRLCGIFLVVGAAFGLAWSHNNPDGYPVICWKIGLIGAFLALIDPSPWWLLLLLFPAGFYLAQKLGLIRLPSLPVLPVPPL